MRIIAQINERKQQENDEEKREVEKEKIQMENGNGKDSFMLWFQSSVPYEVKNVLK